MAIKSVIATINGVQTTLTYNSTTNKYEGTLTAPSKTSYNESGGYYPVTIKVTNTAGTSVTDTTAHLVVKETVKPVITISSPTSGAYVTNNKQSVVFTITDETNGSGIKADSLVVKLDGTTVANTTISKTAITNGYSVTYTPESALSDGSHTVTINVKDNDGNSAVQKTTTFKVDTVAPTLNVNTPTNNLETNNASLVVSGTTNDLTSSPVTLTVNGSAVTVDGTTGAWSKTITLTEGSNTIKVVARDSAGKTTTVTRTVILDTSVPKISNITLNPNPVNTGATMTISLEIS